jgi:hypothetical protein
MPTIPNYILGGWQINGIATLLAAVANAGIKCPQ